ncbi:uncharacterized protein [Euphorbia lathyris]|uniref:uncharacterized protein isoform X2 n=1 Tax=Euphorbia lathyris TaxID=212925 RepID=UPI003313A5C2
MEYLVAEQIPSTFLSHLKTLKLRRIDNLKEIWNFSKIKTPCFTNLCEIDIYKSPKMKHVFPLSVAREFRQLRSMEILDCEEMEEIIYNDGLQIMEENIAKVDESHTIVFPRLKTLKLEVMYKVKVFYDGNHAIELPSLEFLDIDDCNKMEALSYGSFYAPILKEIGINRTSYYPTVGEDLNTFLKKALDAQMHIEEVEEEVIEENDNDNIDEIHQVVS